MGAVMIDEAQKEDAMVRINEPSVVRTIAVLSVGIGIGYSGSAEGQSSRYYEIWCHRGAESAQLCAHSGDQDGTGLGDAAEDQAGALIISCRSDDINGCFTLGLHYAGGLGVAEDQALATALYMTACEGGVAEGCYNAGYQYDVGLGVDQDQGQATALFVAACGTGIAAGCYNAANQYANGRGVTLDEGRATELYSDACDAGFAEGCYLASFRYADGQGVAEDQTRATALLVAACDVDYAFGCFVAGRNYANGFGVREDQTQAEALFDATCELVDEAGIRYNRAWGDAGDRLVTACDNGFDQAYAATPQ